MPELPEVETIKEGLRKKIIGKRIKKIEISLPRRNVFLIGDRMAPIGKKISDLKRRGKYLLISLEEGLLMVIHLGMTGQLLFREKEATPHPYSPYIRSVIAFDDGSHILFADQRRFGKIIVGRETDIPRLIRLGSEPLDKSFTAQMLKEILLSRRNIKSLLLDQKKIAGIGNIYADEILFHAMIHPERISSSLHEGEIQRLYGAIQDILRKGIEKGGTSFYSYVDSDGNRGRYQEVSLVFRREGLTCPRCRAIIKKMRVAGRGTYLCPSCQM